MAGRGDNVGSYVDEESSSSSSRASGEVLSHVDANGAITWITSVGEFGCLLEEIILPSPCQGALFNLGASICGLQG